VTYADEDVSAKNDGYPEENIPDYKTGNDSQSRYSPSIGARIFKFFGLSQKRELTISIWPMRNLTIRT